MKQLTLFNTFNMRNNYEMVIMNINHYLQIE